jgi:hypothetical protein
MKSILRAHALYKNDERSNLGVAIQEPKDTWTYSECNISKGFGVAGAVKRDNTCRGSYGIYLNTNVVSGGPCVDKVPGPLTG